MAYPVPVTQIAFILFRLCNKLIVYDKTNNTSFAKHDLRVVTEGVATSKFILVDVGSDGLHITPQASAPGTGWNPTIFTTDFEVATTLPRLHTLLLDEQSPPSIVVGTGDTRNVVNTAWSFNLVSGVVLSSGADKQLTIYYQGTPLTQTL